MSHDHFDSINYFKELWLKHFGTRFMSIVPREKGDLIILGFAAAIECVHCKNEVEQYLIAQLPEN